jgi:hypothetical protein
MGNWKEEMIEIRNRIDAMRFKTREEKILFYSNFANEKKERHNEEHYEDSMTRFLSKFILSDLKKIFDDAMQLSFDGIEEHINDFWNKSLGLQLKKKRRLLFLKAIVQKEDLDIMALNENLNEFEQKYRRREQKLKEWYLGKDYDDRILEANESLLNLTFLRYNDYEEWLESCSEYREFLLRFPEIENFSKEVNYYGYYIFTTFVKNLYVYIEDGCLPEEWITEYMFQASQFRILQKQNFQPTPEQKEKYEKKEREEIERLLNNISNDKTKAGWLFLLKKEVLKFDYGTGKLELAQEYMNKGKGGATMLAFISAFLSQYLENCNFTYKGQYDHNRVLCKVIGYKISFTKEAYVTIARLFKRNIVSNISKAVAPRQYDGISNCLLAPPKSVEIYDMLQEFERKYNSDAHNATL